MVGMRFQFSTSTLLLGMACIAIALGGGIAGWRIGVADDPNATIPHLFGAVVFMSPWWVPIAFAAYVLGRGRLTARTVVAFAVVEAAGLGGMAWANYALN